jgi:hypothetical protein
VDFRELSAGLPDSNAPAREAASMTSESPALPVWKAFVVQFDRLSGGSTGTFAGRVEHLSSGRRTHFASRDELVAALGALLDEAGEDPE